MGPRDAAQAESQPGVSDPYRQYGDTINSTIIADLASDPNGRAID